MTREPGFGDPTTATATAVARALATAASPPGALARPTDRPDGAVTLPPPYLTLGRPFATDHEVRASRYYPYGTTGHGAYLLHHGVDIGNAIGTPVLAVAAGQVVFAGSDAQRVWGPDRAFYGNLVVLRHAVSLQGEPLASLYGHLDRVLVVDGDRVQAGDVIGEVGMSGIALGPHLHLEVRMRPDDYGATLNPELFLAPVPGTGLIVGRLVGVDGSAVPGIDIALHVVADDGVATWSAQSTTYPPGQVNPAPGWGENFLFGDLAPGRYRLSADLGTVSATADISVTAGAASWVTVRPPSAP